MSVAYSPDYVSQSEMDSASKRSRASASTVGIYADTEAKWRRVIDTLLALRNLGPDWDGEGATAPFPEIVDSAITLIKMREFRDAMPGPPSRISPINDGRIVLEWQYFGCYQSIRFDSPSKAKSMFEAPGKAAEFSSLDL